MKSNPRLIGAVKRVLTLAIVLLATAVCGKADVLKLWQGTYTTSTTWGAMEMIATGEASKQEARIRFTLDGRPADAEISQVKLSATTVSFLAMLAGRQYQFAGARRNNQWEGTLAANGSLNDRGTWRLAHIDLRSAAANAEAPLPMPTSWYSIGRIAFHWVDETRPELETRAPDDRRQVLVYVFYPSEVKQTAVTATTPRCWKTSRVTVTWWPPSSLRTMSRRCDFPTERSSGGRLRRNVAGSDRGTAKSLYECIRSKWLTGRAT